MYRTVFWTLWERARVGWYGRMALKHVYYRTRNGSPVQVQCMRQGAQGWCTGMTQRDGIGREVGGGFRMGNTCTPVADSCQCMAKLLQYCKVIQFSSVTQSYPIFCDPMNRSTPGLPVHHQLPEFTQIHVHWVGDAIQPSHPLSSPSPPALNPSIRVFSNESTLYMRWPKYWSFSFSISPSKEHPGLISFRMDWLDLLAVQGTLKSLL